MLNSPTMTLTPIVYSLLMLILGLGFGAVVNQLRKVTQQSEETI
jgi:hypothetical protein